MPIFDYSCQACGHTFDILQKLGADALTECPACSEQQLKKLLSAPAFHLKGKGWKNSDDAPKKPDVRPKFTHTLDSPVAHAEHSHAGPGKPASHSHDRAHDRAHDHGHSHGKEESGGGLGAIARKAVEPKSHDHSHDHSHGHLHGSKHKHDH
jgi:putative FmdB family regulatory protein